MSKVDPKGRTVVDFSAPTFTCRDQEFEILMLPDETSDRVVVAFKFKNEGDIKRTPVGEHFCKILWGKEDY